jgi:murein DD-endopeptidase MepM/ murein hydrolase activator NlpD
MSRYPYKNNRKGSKKSGLRAGLILIIVIASFVFYQLFLIPEAVIEGMEAFRLLPLDKDITLHVKDIRSIEVYIQQGERRIELLRDSPREVEKRYILHIKPRDLDLKDGQAMVVVTLKAGILKKTKYEIKSTIDTIPPSLTVLKAPSIIYQGGSGTALLKAEDASSVYIRLGDNRFRAFKLKNNYLALFPAPFNLDKDTNIFYAVAEDAVGNQNIKALPTRIKKKDYPSSSITINDNFIKRVISPLLNQLDISDPVSAFKEVNERWRQDSLKRLHKICQDTEGRILWQGRFRQLRNSKVMSPYGESRTYFYNGRQISKSVHLGYDLASVKNAMIEAANSGIVKFTGDLGIYGNTIIIDHGMGLMSLYGHLSEIFVKKGQVVEKGVIIARTGSTGLASGDHLHFGIIIHGFEISPLYWWDPKWIKANVLDYLEG